MLDIQLRSYNMRHYRYNLTKLLNTPNYYAMCDAHPVMYSLPLVWDIPMKAVAYDIEKALCANTRMK